MDVNMRISKTFVLFVGLCCVMVIFYFTVSVAQDKPVETVCLKQLLVASIQAAKRGGNMVKKVKKQKDIKVRAKGKTAEGVMDPVTLGDMLSHEQMYFGLSKMFPDIRIVSEEKSKRVPDPASIQAMNLDTTKISKKLGSTIHSDVRMSDVTVWIDPLDATKEYTEDLLEYVTTMVCVAFKGEPVIGVIHQPFKNRTVWAWKGHGSSAIPGYQTVPKTTDFENMKIIVSRSHAGKVKDLAKKAFGEKSNIISAGGAGYKSLYVAQRNADAYVHMTAIKKWDICAGHALLATMQGDMTDLHGNQIDYYPPPYEALRDSHVKLSGGLVATYQNHKYILKRVKRAHEEKTINIS